MAPGPLILGETSTAVTLYSGQLVAQSEKSVVMTLAPLSGKWKVVYTTPAGTSSLMRAFIIVSPTRLASFTHEPSAIPRSCASDSWRSKMSSVCQMLFAVRRVWAPTLYWLSTRPVVSSSGNLRVAFSSVGTYGVFIN